ncbi:MAG: cytosine methyltransferase [Bacillales bacterium]|jgi:DNA (cytosine-5)-methyltransferase 1|nr:cytosine methyltransferase [Bacillales bacterium]
MMKVVELFAGVGGFRFGLENASDEFNIIWGNQWEPSKKVQHAFNCYSTKFVKPSLHSNQDIAQVDFNDIPDSPNLIVGGFPCQDYSVARSLSGEKGIEGHKGVLFWEIKRFVNQYKPKYVLLENVDRLLKSPSKQRGRDFAIMLATFRDEGYNVEWRVINAADYGFVQRRRRVFIFAYKKDSIFKNVNEFYPETQLKFTGFFAPIFPVLRDVFKTGEIEKTKIQKGNKSAQFILPEDIVEISESFSNNFYNSGVMLNGEVTTVEAVPEKQKETPLETILEKDINKIDEKLFLNDDQKRKIFAMKSAKKIERTSKSGHKYTFSEGGMSCPDDVSKPARTMLTSEGTINRSTHVVFHPGTDRWRFLTPEECEQLNGFPKGWTEGMPNRMRYFCMGNALVVGLITKMGKRLLEIENLEKDTVKNECCLVLS